MIELLIVFLVGMIAGILVDTARDIIEERKDN